jgi:predicted TIM-barrel fold metal-dependent hydrolase
MQTPWGEIEVSDAHVHFFSRAFFASLASQRAAQGLGPATETAESIAAIAGWQAPPVDPQALAAIWVRELDRHGVRRAALIASIPGDENSVAEAVRRFPDRFYGYFMVNPLAADAVDRVRAALAGGKLHCICLFPAMHRFSMQDEHVRPLLEAAASSGALVFVHCGVLTVGVRAKLGLPSPFDMSFSNPIDLHAIALAFPNVRFVVPHFGAGFFRETMMLCDLCPNVYLDTSSSNHWTRYQLEPCELQQVFRRALDVAGPQRLLFGSDSSFFPRGWNATIFEAQTHTLNAMGVSTADARRIFGANLDQLMSS